MARQTVSQRQIAQLMADLDIPMRRGPELRVTLNGRVLPCGTGDLDVDDYEYQQSSVRGGAHLHERQVSD